MLLSSYLHQLTISWLLLSTPTCAAASVDYKVRNAPGASRADTYHAIRGAIIDAAVQKRDIDFKNSTSLDRSWDEAVLLKFAHEKSLGQTNDSSLSVNAGIEIVCTRCYLKGIATVELNITGTTGALIDERLENITAEVQDFTQEAGEYFVNYTKGVIRELGDGIDSEDFDMPTFNYTFEMDIPPIPQCNLRFQFDNMELYMMVNTILSAGATYELNLYRSKTPIGIAITKDLELGVIFAVDLILSVEGQIDISSGFHIKLNDGVAFDITLFADEVSKIAFNGGQFEFLPVIVESAGIVFSAILRVGAHAGFQLATPELPELRLLDTIIDAPSIGGGIEVGVFANVAEFVTNVTYGPEEDCKLQVVQSYQLALGAAAGATIAVGNHAWGPVATTSVPIWYTELGSLCAVQKTASPLPEITATPTKRKRQGELRTITAKTEVTYTGVDCISTGLVNCPASLQRTTRTVETKTIITAIPPGAKFTFPGSVQDTVLATEAFGKRAVSLPSTSGSPVSYVPPPPTVTPKDGKGDITGSVKDKVKENRNLIIGLTCGLGIPLVLGIAAAFLLMRRHRLKKSNGSRQGEAAVTVFNSAGSPEILQGYADHKTMKATVNIAQLGTPTP